MLPEVRTLLELMKTFHVESVWMDQRPGWRIKQRWRERFCQLFFQRTGKWSQPGVEDWQNIPKQARLDVSAIWNISPCSQFYLFFGDDTAPVLECVSTCTIDKRFLSACQFEGSTYIAASSLDWSIVIYRDFGDIELVFLRSPEA